jgi:hypothetical protein
MEGGKERDKKSVPLWVERSVWSRVAGRNFAIRRGVLVRGLWIGEGSKEGRGELTVPRNGRACHKRQRRERVVCPVSGAGGHHVHVVHIVDREDGFRVVAVRSFETSGVEREDSIVLQVGGRLAC